MSKTEKSVKIDTLGRIVIPKGIRKALELEPDTYVDVESDGVRIILTKTEDAVPSREHLQNELNLILDKFSHIPLVSGKVKCARAIIDELFNTIEGK